MDARFYKQPAWALEEYVIGSVGHAEWRVYSYILSRARWKCPRALETSERRIAEALGLNASTVHRAIDALRGSDRHAPLIRCRRGLNHYKPSTFEIIEEPEDSEATAVPSAAVADAEEVAEVPDGAAVDRAQDAAVDAAVERLRPAETSSPIDIESLEAPSAPSREEQERKKGVGPHDSRAVPSASDTEQIIAALVAERRLGPYEDWQEAKLRSVDAETLKEIVLRSRMTTLGAGPLLTEIMKRIDRHHEERGAVPCVNE